MEVGTRLEHFEILAHLGSGGMGSVYRARDLRLQRDVALKLLPAEFIDNAEALQRFRREATVLAGFTHPGIAAIYSVHDVDGAVFLALELVDGEPLSTSLAESPLPPSEIMTIATEVAGALAAAHEQQIIHRDLKPSNVMRDHHGRVKVLDFGIARPVASSDPDATTGDMPTDQQLTAAGALLGTIPFMSPEQVRGATLDERTDIWSFGCLLFELAVGKGPFVRESTADTMAAILEAEPDWSQLPPDLPRPLRNTIEGCLIKDRDSRLSSMAAIGESLREAMVARRTPRGVALALVAAVLLVAVSSAALWAYRNQSATTRAREVLLPEIDRLTAAGQYSAAVAVASEASESLAPEEMASRWSQISRSATLTTVPPGADIQLSEVRTPQWAGAYTDASIEWTHRGQSPQHVERLPLGAYRLRLELEGYRDLEEIVWIDPDSEPHVEAEVPLIPLGAVPPGLTYITPRKLRASVFNLDGFDPTPEVDRYPAYLLGTTEVTNAEYQRFVEAGGYSDTAYWIHAMTDNGRELSFEAATTRFRDRSGRPGPSTWEAGTYPEGLAGHPVAGISWYEAAAFAEFSGAALPTIYHWTSARDRALAVQLTSTSNFGQAGTVAAGSTPFGTHGLREMAGNVREWAWNAVGDSRYILGGAYNDPYYASSQGDLLPPLDRSPTNGMRLAYYLDATASELEPLLQPVDVEPVRYSWGTDVSDEVFDVLKRHYDYDPTPLDATTVAVERGQHWTREKVEFSTGYGETMQAHLYLPLNAGGQLQTIVYYPGVDVMRPIPSDRLQGEALLAALIESGRAVLYPIYRETYERNLGVSHNARSATREYSDRKRYWIQDALRSVDYLASRDDIDMERIAYYGLSWGAEHGPIVLAIEPRFATAVLSDAGALLVPVLPEVDESVFAPRVNVPVLMLNGTHDYIFPVETSQIPFFEHLGTPVDQKRHVTYNAGHVVAASFPREVVAEIRGWLDLTLGPVQ